MSTISTDVQYAWTRPVNGMACVRLQKGDPVTSFRGERWFFEGVARKAYGNSSGRVAVSQYCPSSVMGKGGKATCVHYSHVDGMIHREFYPSVFDLYLGHENGEEA